MTRRLIAVALREPDKRPSEATLQLLRAARAHAALAGRDHVIPEDVRHLAHRVLRHRVLLTYEATADDVRLSLQMDIDALTQGEANSVEIAFGDAETFFQIETQLASDAVRLNGPIEYSANHCVGGRVDYETVTPITFDNDDDFASGTLRLSANDVTVELTFNGDTISYQVVGGESGVITAADLLNVEGC